MALREQEIFDRLMSSFKAAAECCDVLATSPRKGPTYRRLREELRLIEGAARQAGYFRDDARYMKLGYEAHMCHEKAGDWLRSRAPSVYFRALANVLRKMHTDTERLKNARTGRRGVILPKPQALHRDTRPVGWTKTQAGILLPQGAA